MIDECYTRLYDEAVNRVVGDPRDIECANFVIWVANNVERIGDRATDNCERVINMVSGESQQELPVRDHVSVET